MHGYLQHISSRFADSVMAKDNHVCTLIGSLVHSDLHVPAAYHPGLHNHAQLQVIWQTVKTWIKC